VFQCKNYAITKSWFLHFFIDILFIVATENQIRGFSIMTKKKYNIKYINEFSLFCLNEEELSGFFSGLYKNILEAYKKKNKIKK